MIRIFSIHSQVLKSRDDPAYYYPTANDDIAEPQDAADFKY